MPDYHLQRRIPPWSVERLKQELMNNPDISAYDAEAMATEMYEANMEAIYNLARLGETLSQQVEELAKFIYFNIPGEPSASEGAIECAMRIMRAQKAVIDGAAKLTAIQAEEIEMLRNQ